MAGAVEKTLHELGIELPTPAAPIANYVACVRSGNMLVVSGQFRSTTAKKPRAPLPSICWPR
jgi:enamine deaminase RidA (YjgF/YER057c/UK114 family)